MNYIGANRGFGHSLGTPVIGDIDHQIFWPQTICLPNLGFKMRFKVSGVRFRVSAIGKYQFGSSGTFDNRGWKPLPPSKLYKFTTIRF